MFVIIIFWLLVACAAILPTRWTVYLFFAAMPFGSVTVIPGDTTILPVVGVAPLLIFKIAQERQSITAYIDMMLSPRGFAWLTAFIVVALVVTLTAPMLFAGVEIMGLNSLRREGLSFGSGQITQTLYLLVSYLIAISIAMLLATEQGWRTLAAGLLIGASVTVFSGLVDFLTAGTSLLEPLRTARYAIMADAEVNGVRRMIGFNTEAAAFGGLTITFAAMLIFIRPAQLLEYGARIAEPFLAVTLLVMAVMSTSSAAYLALGMVVILFAARTLTMVVLAGSSAHRSQGAISAMVLLMLVIVGAVTVILVPQVANSAFRMIDSILLTKGTSSSYVERGTWNTTSLQALLDTGGYGVGVGGTRASSWLVAVVSCTGILGAIAIFAFLVKSYLTPVALHLRSIANGTRYALPVSLVPAIVVGTSVDFGSINAILFAILTASAMSSISHPRLRSKPIRA